MTISFIFFKIYFIYIYTIYDIYQMIFGKTPQMFLKKNSVLISLCLVALSMELLN